MEGLDRPHHHGGLVDLRQAHIDVQKVGPRPGLLQGLVQDVIHVLPEQGLLEALFPGGVDALADNADPVHGHRPGAAAHRRGDLGEGTPVGELIQPFPCQGDVGGIGAAASAQALDPQPGQVSHAVCKLFRCNVISLAAWVGKPGVGLGHQGQRGPAGQLLQQRRKLPGPQRAVDTDGVGPQALQGQGHRGKIAAQEGAPVVLKGHGTDHWETGIFLYSQKGGLDLIEVGHGLQQHQVGAGLGAGPDHLSEAVVGIVKAQGAGRLQKLAQRADVQSHQGAVSYGLPGQTHIGGDDCLRRAAGARQLKGAGPKGIGSGDLSSGGQIRPVDFQQPVRMLQAGQLGGHAHRQSLALEHGAHGSVQTDKAGRVQERSKVHIKYSPCIEIYSGPGRCRRRSLASGGKSRRRRCPERRSPIYGG